MMPTIYNVQKGHTLKLVISTWDPFTGANLDESYGSDDEELEKIYNYDININNESLQVEIPVYK